VEDLFKQRKKLQKFINSMAKNVIIQMELPSTPMKTKKVSPVKTALTNKTDAQNKINTKLQKVKENKNEANRKLNANDEDSDEKDIPAVTKKIGEISLEDPDKKKKRKRDIQKITCDLLAKRVPEIKSYGCFIKIDEVADKVSYVLLDEEDKNYFSKKIKTKGGFMITLPPVTEEEEYDALAIESNEGDNYDVEVE
jgi:hypothetical protein